MRGTFLVVDARRIIVHCLIVGSGGHEAIVRTFGTVEKRTPNRRRPATDRATRFAALQRWVLLVGR